MKAKDIMKTDVITVTADTNIKDIAQILTDKGISGVPVVNQEGKLVGIVTEGDLLHKEANPRIPKFFGILGAMIYFGGVDQYREDFKKLAALKASEIMTSEVITVSKETDIRTIATLMIEHNIKRIPVVENGKVLGIVSRSDIIKTLTQ
ncbi:CBS domain-containing protein [Desulforamulus hydrothermalis]|uniref:Putative signal transduction protein with CBS domains n=1 Tax=Desulforamulus hydrothermalis Lam5 = DSM 18033 TaxID=1121428 RepID=K8DX27_9FIRM|nr:CBS domain-containing protein [Desulforamulus hydrothermalis]CCO07092.1 putative signal transduction protein with CBS domains [Desulforamulus hydrothermalis Lam5 = DSM 18033]SHG90352.1 CBS domain-containing protein [Desulforamulus hydrothermalis Lam5 = DSM 18033]